MGHGADWIKRAHGKPMSEFGEEVADLLDSLFSGIYHIDGNALWKVDWSIEHFVVLNLNEGSQRLATYDFDLLTGLVVLSHDRCIRVSLEPCSMNSVTLTFHPRKRSDGELSFAERMPTLEDHVDQLRHYLK